MDSKTTLNRVDRIRELPTLPLIALEVNKLLDDPDVSITDVCGLLEKDQSIAMKILKLVNSAFYGCPSRVSSLSKAVMMLGFNTIRNAVLSVSVIDAFSNGSDLEDFKMANFWRHSVAVAVAKKLLN